VIHKAISGLYLWECIIILGTRVPELLHFPGRLISNAGSEEVLSENFRVGQDASMWLVSIRCISCLRNRR
jgi:hypothetical protein